MKKQPHNQQNNNKPQPNETTKPPTKQKQPTKTPPPPKQQNPREKNQTRTAKLQFACNLSVKVLLAEFCVFAELRRKNLDIALAVLIQK